MASLAPCAEQRSVRKTCERPKLIGRARRRNAPYPNRCLNEPNESYHCLRGDVQSAAAMHSLSTAPQVGRLETSLLLISLVRHTRRSRECEASGCCSPTATALSAMKREECDELSQVSAFRRVPA